MPTSKDAGSKDPAPPPRQNGSLGLVIVLVAGVLLAYVTLRNGGPGAGELVGIMRPPLHVSGWLNTTGPVRDDALRGKVVLIDCWASWCGPCRAKMPSLVAFEQKYRGQGLVVIGLTPEDGQELGNVQSYVASVPGFTWPIGVGANLPIDVMGVSAFPTLILFNKSGVSTWAGHGFDGLEAATLAALASPSL